MHTLAEARERLTVTGWGDGVLREVAEEKEERGSESGEGEANGVEESRRTDEPEGAERNVWGG